MAYGTLNAGTITPGSGNTLSINEGVAGTAILDEDAMGSDSATKLATQQSIKAYVDSAATTATTAAQGVGTGDSPEFGLISTTDTYSFKLYLSGDQSLGTTTSATKVQLNAKLSNSYDCDTGNYKFVPNLTGRYFLNAQVDMYSRNNEMMWVYIYNGASVIGQGTQMIDNGGTATTDWVVSFSMIADITAGDNIYMYAQSGSTISKTIRSGEHRTSLSGMRLL